MVILKVRSRLYRVHDYQRETFDMGYLDMSEIKIVSGLMTMEDVLVMLCHFRIRTNTPWVKD